MPVVDQRANRDGGRHSNIFPRNKSKIVQAKYRINIRAKETIKRIAFIKYRSYIHPTPKYNIS